MVRCSCASPQTSASAIVGSKLRPVALTIDGLREITTSGADLSSTHTNIAARAARWSAVHRKKAIFGWLAFVIIAFMFGNNVVGQTTISTVDGFNGESHDAEEAADAAGLRPNAEVVLVQSDELTIEDPEFTTAIEDVTARLAAVKYVENVESPLDEGGSVSEDGRSALVDFEIAGDSTEARDRLDPTLAAVAAVQKDNPSVTLEQFGDVSARPRSTRQFSRTSARQGCCPCPSR